MAARVLHSDNDTGTMSDALKAVGLAECARAWLLALGREAAPITIEGLGDYYRITLPSVLDTNDVQYISSPFAVGRATPLLSKRQIEKMQNEGSVAEGFLYETEQEKRDAYVKQRLALAPADRARFGQDENAFPELRDLRPHPDLGLYVYVNHFKVADGYNGLLRQWSGDNIEKFHANLSFILDAFSTHPNQIGRAVAEWTNRTGTGKSEAVATLLQLINPSSGKGSNAPKASGLNSSGMEGFWLLEYLKFVGLFTIAAPVMLQDTKDRKTYVLHPMKVQLDVIREVMHRFRSVLYRSTAVKQDILATLRFTSTLVGYIRPALSAPSSASSWLALFDEKPRITDIAQGFQVAFYKDMGSAYATMNLATVNLPSWMEPITSPAAADDVLAFLAEHERVIKSIRSAKGDEGSDELELLRRYRDFLSGQDVLRFFDCAAAYGDYYVAKRNRNQWASQFTTDGMEHLMAQSPDTKFTEVVQNDGFREIARAIRRATVTGQYWASRVNGYPFEVRYGLGQELLRAASYPDTFLAQLGEFVQAYNAENARVDERIQKGSLPNMPQNRRAMVRTTALDEIVRLVDEKGSEVICKMLVAYGYARDPRAPDPTPGPTSDEEQATEGE